MVLSISTTHNPATDLGYLLAKNPAHCHTRDTTFGRVNLFFSTATEARSEAVVLLEVDPIKLVRKEDSNFTQYVNDAPYALNSFMSVGLREILSTAIAGRSKERQELAETAIPLEIRLPVLPVQGRTRETRSLESRAEFVTGLFEPLGWTVSIAPVPLDENFPEWGASSYLDVTLTGTLKVQDALRQIYILLPVLDNNKHYWIDSNEIEKLVRSAGEWLPSHPRKDLIIRRYLRKADFIRSALDRLLEEEPLPDSVDGEIAEAEQDVPAEPETPEEKPLTLHELRLETVASRLAESGARSVLDLGCGEGKLLRLLARNSGFRRIVGIDVSYQTVERLHKRMERLPSHVANKIEVLHGSLTYIDRRLNGFDAAALVEVIEHLDLGRLEALEQSVFGAAKPTSVFVTTPNREYNEIYGLEGFRHEDHRFEWTRAEFAAWCARVAETFNYTVEVEPLGPVDDNLGAPSQMGVFRYAD